MKPSDPTEQPCNGSKCIVQVIGYVKTISDISGTDDGSDGLFNIIFITLSSILSIITIFGNVTAFVAIILERKYHKKTDYFLGSMAVSGTYIGCISIPTITYYTVVQKWEFGDLVCSIFTIVDYIMTGIAQHTVYLITLDRYLSVTRPVWYRNWRTNGKIITMLTLVCVFNILLWTTFILTVVPDSYVYNPQVCISPFLSDPWITFAITILNFWIFTFIMIYQYWQIYRVMHALNKRSTNRLKYNPAPLISSKSNGKYINQNHSSINKGNAQDYKSYTTPNINARLIRNVKGVNLTSNHISDIVEVDGIEGTSVDPPASAKETTSEKTDIRQATSEINDARPKIETNAASLREVGNRKNLIIVTSICGIFLFSWLPLNVAMILPPLCGYLCVSDTVYLILAWLTYVNSAANPYAYAYMNPKYRTVFRTVFRNCFRCRCCRGQIANAYRLNLQNRT